MNVAQRLILLSCSWMLVFAAHAAEPRQFDEADSMRQYEVQLRDAISKSQGHFVCAGIGVLDRGAAIDGPLYYFRESPRELISQCGGACMNQQTPAQIAMCANLCPPPEWTANRCNERRRDAYSANRPTLTEAAARATAASRAGCTNPKTKCKIATQSVDGNWVFEITYLEFQDKDMETWVSRFGMSRIVMGPKGQFIKYRDMKGIEH